MENGGKIEKWDERKDFCFSLCVFGKRDGKVEGDKLN